MVVTGTVHWLKDCIAYYYLKYRRRNRKGRIEELYDIMCNDVYKLGILIPSAERIFDFPRSHLENVDDNIFIFGTNSQNEKLIARISRQSPEIAIGWLYLQLSNGKRYIHVENDKPVNVPKTGDDTFAVGGLRLRCLAPMRKWRVSYSGMLREYHDDAKDGPFVFVKFSFVWTASSEVIDHSTDIPESVLSSYMASQKWNGWLPDYGRLETCLDIFEQSGMLSGTVTIQEEEQEMYLWGGRKRSIENSDKPEKSMELFGNLKDGDYFHISRLYLPNSRSSLEYGFIAMPTGFVHMMNNFEVLVTETQEASFQNGSINFKRDKHRYHITIGKSTQHMKIGSTDVQYAPITMEDDVGEAIMLQNFGTIPVVASEELPINISVDRKELLVCNIKDLNYKHVDQAGGKGASLGQLNSISRQHNSFTVPKGIVITTEAYDVFLASSTCGEEIIKLQDTAWKNVGDLKEACQRVVTKMSQENLPIIIQTGLESSLNKLFEDSLDSTKFAVRSSALGEDSESMSAAGQMETFLGIQGLSEILKAVAKCWASQFSYTAVQYKRQYGQLLNTPMAVVVQEMVSPDAAGVIFTCDPVTGNPFFVNVTANYGIGESVVSASADPDTLVYERNENNELKLHSVEIGTKATKIVLSDSDGVQEAKTSQQESEICCIDSNSGLLLARVALQIENSFGCPMDIEWAVKDGHIYLLQARPITTYDKETDFEIRHELDAALPCEYEYTSMANVGEVLPGAMSFLGLTSTCILFNVNIVRKWMERSKTLFPFKPHTWKGFAISQNHFMFNLFDTLLRFHKDGGSIVTDSQMIAMFGRILDDTEMMQRAMRRNKKDSSKSFAPKQFFYIAGDVLLCGKRLQQSVDALPSVTIDFKDCSNAEMIFMKIMSSIIKTEKYLSCHGECSFSSSLYNLAMLSTLRKEKGGWHEDVYSDFAFLLSNCPKVESVDVPCAIQKLAFSISGSIDSSIFQKMETEEALAWLQTTDAESGQLFADFLEKHGHRCVKEFDVYSKPWGANPIPLVKTLQEMVGRISNEDRKNKELNVAESLDKLKVQLSWKSRMFLKFLIPFSRRAVGRRERSKSVIIKVVDIIRRAYRCLEVKMVEEGRLPDGELLYFLTIFEIDDLLRTRSPKLIQKAIRRKQIYKEMDELRFPEVMTGIPRPMNVKRKDFVFKTSLTMKGIPVSQGISRGKARVAISLEEAARIQPGEILIAYSTDIGWSPYFPMLAGVATELGGLISHGAVVAREYGLPCVVGVHGATEEFQTGDLILLDGTKGVLQRIDNDQDEENGVATAM